MEKAAKGLDRSSVENRFNDLTKTLHEKHPNGPASEFPHKTECKKLFTKGKVKNRLKKN